MTDPKFLPLPEHRLRLTYNPPEEFVDESYFQTFLDDLSEYVSQRTSELQVKRLTFDNASRRFRASQQKLEEANPWLDILKGASLAFSYAPVQPRRRHINAVYDIQAIRRDWLSAVSDLNKVWHTFQTCAPEQLQPQNERPERSQSADPKSRSR
jgi:hypothetical protein